MTVFLMAVIFVVGVIVLVMVAVAAGVAATVAAGVTTMAPLTIPPRRLDLVDGRGLVPLRAGARGALPPARTCCGRQVGGVLVRCRHRA